MEIFYIIRNNFRRSFHKKIPFFINFFIPIFVVMLGVFANILSKPSFTIGVIDNNSNYSHTIVNTLKKSNGITIENANKDRIQIDTMTGKFSAVVVFENKNFKIHSVKDENTIQDLTNIINQAYQSNTPIDVTSIVKMPMSIAQRTIAFLILFLTVTSIVTASLLIKDKNTGTLKRIQYSPLKS